VVAGCRQVHSGEGRGRTHRCAQVDVVRLKAPEEIPNHPTHKPGPPITQQNRTERDQHLRFRDSTPRQPLVRGQSGHEVLKLRIIPELTAMLFKKIAECKQLRHAE